MYTNSIAEIYKGFNICKNTYKIDLYEDYDL